MFPRYAMGQVEVICGPMFSGKTEELIRRLKRARIARQRVQVFKPAVDNRYAKDHVVSHSQDRVEALVVASSAEVMRLVDDRTEVIGIDEVQFFDAGIVEVIEKLANRGKRVVVAGLDQDYLGRPFDPMPRIMAVAEYVTKASAVCVRCGAPASRSQRLTSEDGRVLVGATDAYEPRCRRCFEPDLSRQLGMDLGPKPLPTSTLSDAVPEVSVTQSMTDVGASISEIRPQSVGLAAASDRAPAPSESATKTASADPAAPSSRQAGLFGATSS